MRFLLFTSLIASLGLSGRAAEQFIEVTPLTLDGWTVAGTGGNTLSSGSQLVLPAGVQLSRKFSDPVLVVHLVARPVFSEQGENWPILGLGSAALAFVRQEGQGHLVLVTAETAAVDLPWTVPLDSNGKQGSIDLLLAYDRVTGTGLVSFQNQVRVFEVAPAVGPTDVSLSAGVRSDWAVDLLQVLLPDLDAAATGTSNLENSSSSEPGPHDTGQLPVNKLRAALDQLRASEAAGTSAGAATSADQTKVVAAVPSLEVFTPPSVRRTRVVSAVRDAVSRILGK